MPSDFDHYSIKIKWAFHLKEEAINNKKENTCYSDGVYLSRVYCMKLSTLHIFLGGLFLGIIFVKMLLQVLSSVCLKIVICSQENIQLYRKFHWINKMKIYSL